MPNEPQFDATDPQFVPVDPSQWHTRGLPHIIVRPYAPPNASSDNRLVSDSPDGLNAERKLGQNLHEYYPVIDIHDPKTGAVTSIKSIDLRAPRYRELPNSVHTALRRHVNRLANFEGADFAGHVVPKGSITSRTLLIAAPKSQTAPQRSALQRTIEYGNQHGVTVKVVVLR